MSIPIISYNLHDNVVEKFNFDSIHGRLIVIIWDKAVGSINIIWWQLIVSGIKNIKELEQYQKRIDLILVKAKRAELGYRVDDFTYSDNFKSELRNLYLILSIDRLGTLLINCAKFTIQVIDGERLDLASKP